MSRFLRGQIVMTVFFTKIGLNSIKEYLLDFIKSIFAQEEENRKKLKLKFEEVENVDEKYFSGTHYSNPGFISYYLIRQKPYSIFASDIQGGYFDNPDRLFYDIKLIYDINDIFQELITEMFYLSECLVNYNNFKFGQTQFIYVVNDVYSS